MVRHLLWRLVLILAYLSFPMFLPFLCPANPAYAQAVSNSLQVSPISMSKVDNPKSCKIGLYVDSLHDFSMVDKTFNADLWIWSICADGSYNPLSGMEFVNANSVTISLPSNQQEKGQYWSAEKVMGVFRQNWDVQNYPFDRDTLQIVMEDANYDVTSFVYVPDTTANSTYDPNMELSDWRITGFRLSVSQHTYPTAFGDLTLPPGHGSTYSQVRADITIARAEDTSFLKLTAPAYIAFAIVLITFFLTNLGSRITLLAGALFTVVVNMRVASDALGSSSGLTLVDKLHILTLFSILVAVAITVFRQWRLDRKQLGGSIERWDLYGVGVLALLYIVTTVALVRWAIFFG